MFTAFMLALSLTTTANTLVVMSISRFSRCCSRAWYRATRCRCAPGSPPPRPGRHRVDVRRRTLRAGRAPPERHAGRARHPVRLAINVVTLRAAAGRLDLVPALVLGGAMACAFPCRSRFRSAPRRATSRCSRSSLFQLGLPCMLVVIASRSLLAPEIALLGLLEVVLGPLWAWLGAGEIPAMRRSPGRDLLLALISNELAGIRPERSAA